MSETLVERSAGGVVVRWVDGRPHALLIRDPYKNWGLPKGHLEDGEDLGAAARREVQEETGVSEVVMGDELGTIDWSFRLEGRRIHKYCTFFLMTTEQEHVSPEEAEGITECVWLPLDEAVQRVTYDNAREMLREAARRIEDGDSQS